MSEDTERSSAEAVPAANGNAMLMTPRVSIVIPAYNEAESIVPALDRVLDGLMVV